MCLFIDILSFFSFFPGFRRPDGCSRDGLSVPAVGWQPEQITYASREHLDFRKEARQIQSQVVFEAASPLVPFERSENRPSKSPGAIYRPHRRLFLSCKGPKQQWL